MEDLKARLDKLVENYEKVEKAEGFSPESMIIIKCIIQDLKDLLKDDNIDMGD